MGLVYPAPGALGNCRSTVASRGCLHCPGGVGARGDKCGGRALRLAGSMRKERSRGNPALQLLMMVQPGAGTVVGIGHLSGLHPEFGV